VVGDHFEYDASPEVMAEHARELHKLGIDLIGRAAAPPRAHVAAMRDEEPSPEGVSSETELVEHAVRELSAHLLAPALWPSS
jgi:hypothetical protein